MFTIKNTNRSDYSEVLRKNYLNQVILKGQVQSRRPEVMKVDGNYRQFRAKPSSFNPLEGQVWSMMDDFGGKNSQICHQFFFLDNHRQN